MRPKRAVTGRADLLPQVGPERITEKRIAMTGVCCASGLQTNLGRKAVTYPLQDRVPTQKKKEFRFPLSARLLRNLLEGGEQVEQVGGDLSNRPLHDYVAESGDCDRQGITNRFWISSPQFH
jgi:hypothetical protein